MAKSNGNDYWEEKMMKRNEVKQREQLRRWLRRTNKMPAIRLVNRHEQLSQYAAAIFKRKPYGGHYEKEDT